MTGMKYGCILGIVYFIYLSIAALAGQVTLASIGISILGNVTVSDAVAYIFGGGGIIYGLNERRVRKSTVERVQGRNVSLEKRLDPGRTSSQLTPRGDTHPDDQ
jgi:hypothetical protein